ncbi:hypothetical protein EV122DRAFT_281186 [Schizophyllum commune]
MRIFVAGLWDALGRVAHVQDERKAAWARSAEADSTLMSVTSDSTAGAQSYAHMPLESADLLLAMSEGSSDVGSGTVCVAMKRKDSTPVALAEAIASESATYGSSGGGASLTTTEEISADDTRATRQAAISTILGGAHRPDDMLSVTFSRVEVQNLGGDVKVLRSALDVARTARMARTGQDAPLRTALHDVASARADTHAAREEAGWKEVLVKAHVKLEAEVEELKKLGIIGDYTFLLNAFIPPSFKPSVAGDGAKRFGDPEHAGCYQSRARRG